MKVYIIVFVALTNLFSVNYSKTGQYATLKNEQYCGTYVAVERNYFDCKPEVVAFKQDR